MAAEGTISTRTRAKCAKMLPQVQKGPVLLTNQKASPKSIKFNNFYTIRLIPRRDDAIPGKVAITGSDDETIYHDLVLPNPCQQYPIIYKDKDPDVYSSDGEASEGPFLVEYTAALNFTPQMHRGKRRKSGVVKQKMKKDNTLSADLGLLQPEIKTVASTSTSISPAAVNIGRAAVDKIRKRRSSRFIVMPVELQLENLDSKPDENTIKYIETRVEPQEGTIFRNMKKRRSSRFFPMLETENVGNEMANEIKEATDRTNQPIDKPLERSVRRRSSRFPIFQETPLSYDGSSEADDESSKSWSIKNAENKTRRRRSSRFFRLPNKSEVGDDGLKEITEVVSPTVTENPNVEPLNFVSPLRELCLNVKEDCEEAVVTMGLSQKGLREVLV